MSAVLRLSWSYFTATPLLRAVAMLGWGLALVGVLGYLFTPVFTFGTGMRREALWYQTMVLTLPWLGLMLLIASTALMPGIVERFLRGRSVWVLPGGRWRLLASVVIPPLLLGVLTATAATTAFLAYQLQFTHTTIFYRTLLMAFVDFGLIYAGIWLVGKTSGVWRLVGLFWVLLSIAIPGRYLGGIPPFSPLEGLGLALWLVFAAVVLSGGRIRHGLRGLRHGLQARTGPLSRSRLYTGGHEVDLLLGTTRPWVIALGQIVPIGAMFWFIRVDLVWLFFLMIFSAIAGAITSQAAGRSRKLWLRFDWTREELRRHVERAFWRFNLWSLAVLLLLLLALSSYFGVDLPVVAHGVALLVLGCAVCTYLGFMITRGLGWFESTLCILTMIALTLTGIMIIHRELTVALELELLLGALTIMYLVLARARWTALDWMQCRPDGPGRGAA